jgi:hypothetical protein
MFVVVFSLYALVIIVGSSCIVIGSVELANAMLNGPPLRGQGIELRRSIASVIMGVSLLLLVAPFVAAAINGGFAATGKIMNGIYYLGNHGVFVAVSRRLYITMYSLEVLGLCAGVVFVVCQIVSNHLGVNASKSSSN